MVLALAVIPHREGATGGDADGWPGTRSPDVDTLLLAADVATGLPPLPATLALGRITLAPGAALTVTDTRGPWLVAVEAGALELTTGAGPVAALPAGQGALIQPASDLIMRNTGNVPLVVLLATILPSAARTEAEIVAHSHFIPRRPRAAMTATDRPTSPAAFVWQTRAVVHGVFICPPRVQEPLDGRRSARVA